MANAYYNDTTIKFEHSPVNNKTAFQRETIGAHAYETLSVKNYTDTDANTIYVNTSSGSDSTGTGAKATPFKTYVHGANACTALKTKVIILNSAFVSEDFSALSSAYFEGFYADTGITATYSGRVLPIVPDDTNSIFVDKTGNDANAGTAASPKLTIAGAIAATTASKTAVVIQDSETYEDVGFEFTGNFNYLLAADQCAPTINPSYAADYDYSLSEDVFSQDNIIADSTSFFSIKDGLGNIYIFYTESSSPYNSYICKITESGSIVSLSSAISGISAIRIFLNSSNNFVIFYRKTINNKIYYKILDSSFSEITAETIVEDETTNEPRLALKLSDGGFLVTYTDQYSTYQRYKIYNVDFTVRKSITNTLGNPFNDLIQLSGGNIVWCDTNSTGYYITIIDIDGNIIFDEGIVYNPSSPIQVYPVYCETNDNNFIVMFGAQGRLYSHTGTLLDSFTPGMTINYNARSMLLPDGNCLFLNGNSSNLIVINQDGTIIKNYGNIFYPHGIYINNLKQSAFPCSILLDNGNIFYLAKDETTDDIYSRIWFPYYEKNILASIESEINGINFNFDRPCGCGFFATNKLTIKNCNISNAENSSDSYKAKAVNSSSEIDFQNNIVLDCDSGIYTEENTAAIKKNIFSRLAHGYAVHVKGTAASSGDIIIDHNTFFSVYGGIRLEDNGATNEIVKNCIFQDCNVYDVLAETAKTFYNSVYTGNLSNATASGCIKANALFVNEGAYDPDDIDLRIKKIILGYYADSPAHGLGLDSLDAGAYNQLEIGGVDSWTSFTVEKPVNGVDIWLEPSEMYKTISQDGTANSKNKGFTEYIELQFLGIKNAEFTNFLALMSSTSNQVRIYLDPTTNPADFQLYRYIPGKILASAKNFRLGRTGVQDVKILFARKYE